MANDDALSTLAFIYLTFSHATNGNLAMEEMRTLADKVKSWAPGASLEQIGHVIKGSVAEYKQVPAGHHLATARQKASALATFADPGARARIIADLEAIAGADGEVSAGERTFIDELQAQFAS